MLRSDAERPTFAQYGDDRVHREYIRAAKAMASY